MRIALVNANRLMEGILRNILQEDNMLLFLPAAAIEARLMGGTVLPSSGLAVPEKNQTTGSQMEDAKKDISALLDSAPPPASAPIVSTASRPMFEADCILYHLTETGEKPLEDVRLLRKTCAFRDVPILVLSEIAFMVTARELIRVGASDILPLPLTLETLRGKLDKLMRPVGEKVPVITKLINPFINATLDLMTTMAGLQVKRKDLFLKKNYRLFGDISGIMNFSGKIDGAVVVSFNDDLAREIVGRILGLAPETLTPDERKDGVGEIINIISGNAKANLSTTEFGHEISLPTVVTGPGHEIRHPQHAPCIVIIFEADCRPFAVQVSMSINL